MGGVRRRALVLAAVLTAAGALALVLLTGGSSDEERPRPGPPAPTATTPVPAPAVDVRAVAELGAAPTPAPSMSGFLHSLSETSPPDDVLLPLRPRLWRSVPSKASPARAARLGARYQLVLSDLWGYPGNGWNGHGPPWRDLAGWARTVRAAAESVRGLPIEWDVWNEPDNPAFFTGTREQYLRLYGVAYRVLRQEIGPRRRGGRAQHHEAAAGVARGPAPRLPPIRLPGRVPVLARQPPALRAHPRRSPTRCGGCGRACSRATATSAWSGSR